MTLTMQDCITVPLFYMDWDVFEEHRGEYTPKALAEKTIEVAPVGETAIRCTECQTFLSPDDVWLYVYNEAKCSRCGAFIDRGLVDVLLLHSQLPLVQDEEHVLSRSWFHATKRTDWIGDLTRRPTFTSLVHLGTRAAALDRATHVSQYPGEDEYGWLLYEVAIKARTKVFPYLMDDHDNSAPRVVEEPYAAYWEAEGVTRYVNRHESPGEISLLANYQCLEVVGVTELVAEPRNSDMAA